MCLNPDESGAQLGRGHRKKVASVKVAEKSDQSVGFTSDGADGDRVVYTINDVGRFICSLCDKTFKTVSRCFLFWPFSKKLRASQL